MLRHTGKFRHVYCSTKAHNRDVSIAGSPKRRPLSLFTVRKQDVMSVRAAHLATDLASMVSRSSSHDAKCLVTMNCNAHNVA